MKQLRRSVVTLLVFLAIFYNIERLDFGQRNLIDIQSMVYVIGLAAVISIILVPLIWRAHIALPMLLWSGVLIVCKLIVPESRPLFGGIYTYLFITEFVLLNILVALTHNVAGNLYEFEEAVKNITFADVSHRVKKLSDVEEDIQTELLRSRRHHYPLTIMVIQPDPQSIRAVVHRMVHEVQQAMISRYVITSLARVIGDQLRRTDMVIDQHEQGRFIVVSPDTGSLNSIVLADRVKSAASEKLGVELSCGVASFPDEALTFEELVHHAGAQLQKSSTETISVSIPFYTPDKTKI